MVTMEGSASKMALHPQVLKKVNMEQSTLKCTSLGFVLFAGEDSETQNRVTLNEVTFFSFTIL